eukprot:6296787-Amphidinium_carterae.1
MCQCCPPIRSCVSLPTVVSPLFLFAVTLDWLLLVCSELLTVTRNAACPPMPVTCASRDGHAVLLCWPWFCSLLAVPLKVACSQCGCAAHGRDPLLGRDLLPYYPVCC